MTTKDWLPYVTALATALGFMFSVYQYADTQRLEERNNRFDQYHRVFEWVAGRTATGQELVNTQQAAAVYQLTRFPEYKDLSLPIIDYYLEVTTDDPDDSLFRAALVYTRGELSD
ncbi:MAG: hypothetical protein OXT64_04165 [Gammaproteobacteria bacterium]|nr:hypothetical protein [Gammaproteobacteria bacterium]